MSRLARSTCPSFSSAAESTGPSLGLSSHLFGPDSTFSSPGHQASLTQAVSTLHVRNHLQANTPFSSPTNPSATPFPWYPPPHWPFPNLLFSFFVTTYEILPSLPRVPTFLYLSVHRDRFLSLTENKTAGSLHAGQEFRDHLLSVRNAHAHPEA